MRFAAIALKWLGAAMVAPRRRLARAEILRGNVDFTYWGLMRLGVIQYSARMKTNWDSAKISKRRNGSTLLTRVSTWFFVNLVALAALVVAHFALCLSSIKWWSDVFAITTNLLTGGLVSFLFYYLVVYLPERRKKSIFKANLQKMYRNIKMDILWAIVHASIKGGRHDLIPSSEFVESLTSPAAFKMAFEDGREGDEGFYAFENQMNDETPEFRQIVSSLTMLSKQIEFVLHNYSIDDQDVFDFFKRLELLLMSLQTNGAGYDDSKPLCRFIWEVYAGWNWIEGYIGDDQIQKMINGL